MMPSSTSRFLVSILALREVVSVNLDSSDTNLDLLSETSISKPSSSVRRALILSETAFSALARFFKRALKRAACTGGVGAGFDVNFSYSMSDVDTAVAWLTSAFETATCRGTKGSSSGGAEEDDENKDPPSIGLRAVDRFLSSSGGYMSA